MADKAVNIPAEQAVLGAMIESSDFRVEALGALTRDDFYRENHSHIFEAISNLVNKSKVVDITTITDELLNHMKTLDKDGGVEFLYELQQTFIGEKHALHHLNIVRDLSLLRKLLKELNAVITDFNDPKKAIKSVPDFVANTEKRVLDITKTRRVGSFQNSAEVVEKISAKLKENRGTRLRSNSYVTGVDTGFTQLNKFTQGFHPGALVILAARPSIGKTALAINLAYNAASLSNKTVAFFSLEMSAEDIVTRLLASRAQINSRNLVLGNLNENDWLALSEAVEAIKQTRILIDDTSAARLNDIKTKAQKLKAQDPNLGLIVIDYLGLITTSEKYDSHQIEIAEISRSLKALARELEVPILCLCQLSRASEKRTDRTPILSDLRDSGSIEQDADQVMFIYRPNYQRPDELRKEAMKQKTEEEENDPLSKCEETHVVLSKNRNGQTGIVYLNFFMNIGKFVELDLATIMHRKEAE